MTKYNLTAAQQQFLSTLVRLTNEGKLKDPIVPIPVQNGKSGTLEYVLHLRGEDSFYFKNIGDLDIFCNMGFMTFRWNRQGIGKLFTLTQSAVSAVENEFELPFSPPGPRFRPDLIIQAMTGSFDPTQPSHLSPELGQITADPILLHSTVEALLYSIIEEVRPTLKGHQLLDYSKTLNDFREAVFHGRIAPKDLQIYARRLAGLDQEFPLLLNAWPYLYPLLLIAEKR